MSETTLTSEEREALAAALARATRSPEHLAFLVEPAVEGIVRDRMARDVPNRIPRSHASAMRKMSDEPGLPLASAEDNPYLATKEADR